MTHVQTRGRAQQDRLDPGDSGLSEVTWGLSWEEELVVRKGRREGKAPGSRAGRGKQLWGCRAVGGDIDFSQKGFQFSHTGDRGHLCDLKIAG